MRDCRAFTIVEVLVTVLLLSIGFLALATTTGLATNMITTGRRFTQLTAVASQHLAAFQSGPCGPPGAAEHITGAFHLRWTTNRVSARAGYLVLRVTVRSGGRTRHATLSAVHAC